MENSTHLFLAFVSSKWQRCFYNCDEWTAGDMIWSNNHPSKPIHSIANHLMLVTLGNRSRYCSTVCVVRHSQSSELVGALNYAGKRIQLEWKRVVTRVASVLCWKLNKYGEICGQMQKSTQSLTHSPNPTQPVSGDGGQSFNFSPNKFPTPHDHHRCTAAAADALLLLLLLNGSSCKVIIYLN